MDNAVYRLIDAVHRSPAKCVLAVTGGGTRVIAQLLSVPGGSRTVLEAVVPYHAQALLEFLGAKPENFCSPEVSRQMARRARERGRWLLPGQAVIGVGCTASLATDRPKRGDHRFHITVESESDSRTYSLRLTKGARAREAEESVLAAVLLNALAEACGVIERIDPGLFPAEQIATERLPAADPLSRLLRGESSAVRVDIDGRHSEAPPSPTALVPGAFNPMHEAHWRLRAAAETRFGLPSAFELSVVNVDKPPLAAEEVRHRLHQFAWKAVVWLTRAPTFAEKAGLFPGSVFAVGADTAARVVAPRYYQDDAGRMGAALETIRGSGCRFLVAGRAEPGGKFLCVEDLSLPPRCRDLFLGIPETEFRIDISSTQLRRLADEFRRAGGD